MGLGTYPKYPGLLAELERTATWRCVLFVTRGVVGTWGNRQAAFPVHKGGGGEDQCQRNAHIHALGVDRAQILGRARLEVRNEQSAGRGCPGVLVLCRPELDVADTGPAWHTIDAHPYQDTLAFQVGAVGAEGSEAVNGVYSRGAQWSPESRIKRADWPTEHGAL